MAFHLAALWGNIAQAGTLQPLTAAAGEQVLFPTGDEIRVPDGLASIVAAAGIVGQTNTRALLVSPSLRDVFNIDISPLNDGGDGDCLPSAAHQVLDLRSSPVALSAGESLTAEANPATAGAWSNGALTFLQTIPVGTYAVVGMRAEGTTLVAARLVFRGGGWRPGVMGSVNAQDEGWAGFRNGGFGIFGGVFMA